MKMGYMSIFLVGFLAIGCGSNMSISNLGGALSGGGGASSLDTLDDVFPGGNADAIICELYEQAVVQNETLCETWDAFRITNNISPQDSIQVLEALELDCTSSAPLQKPSICP